MVTICFLALSLDIILVGEILKYRYTACIPSCLDNEDVFMIACIDTSSLRRSSLRVMHGLGRRQAFYGRVHIILWVWFPVCPLFGGNFVLKSHVGSLSFVCCPESRSVRFSEVALVLQLC